MRFLPTSQQVSEQMPDAPRWQRVLARFRFLLAGIYLLCTLGIFAFIVIQGRPFDLKDAIQFFVVVSIFFGSQTMLLAGAPYVRRHRPTHRRHIAVSIVAGATAAALLSFGFIATGTSLLGHTLDWTFPNNTMLPVLFLVGGPWIFWLVLFTVMWSQRWGEGFGKMYRLLVAGTFVEVLFTIPVDVIVRRRTSCYCDEGTFYAWVAGGTMALWTFGPGVVLLFLAVRFRRAYPKGICRQCGYDLRGLPENRCPECGLAFEPP